MLLPVTDIRSIISRLIKCHIKSTISSKLKSNRWYTTDLNYSYIRFASSISITHNLKPTNPKKILFFGTDDFSLAILKSLNGWILKENEKSSTCNNESSRENRQITKSLAVCTAKMKDLIQPVKVYADQYNLVVHSWPPDPVNIIQKDGYDLGIVASFGHLIPKKIIEAFPLGVLNVHGSLLPRWRGASPIAHAIMAGDKETGITIMEVKPHHFDIGHMLARESVSIGCDQSREELSEVMANVGAELMVKVLKDIDLYRLNSLPQDKSEVTYAPCIEKSFYSINWSTSTSKDVYNQSRALSGKGKLYSTWKDTGAKVMFANIIKPEIVDTFDIKLSEEEEIKPGRVVYVKRKYYSHAKGKTEKGRFICVKCKSGWIAFINLYYGTNKVMSSEDFFNGYMSNHRTRPQYFIQEILSKK